MTGPRPLVIGHRGAPRRAPENTVGAIEAASAEGADGVEIDVRVAGDGSVVVLHDADLDRTTAARGPVTAAHLVLLRSLGVPTLADVVALTDRLGLWLNIEVKEADERIAAALAGVGLAHGGVVSSFLPAALALVAAAAPHLPRALLTLPGTDAAEACVAASVHGHWNPFFLTVLEDPGTVTRAHASGLGVHVWTVDDADHVRAMAAAGVDSVITNDPALARAALAHR